MFNKMVFEFYGCFFVSIIFLILIIGISIGVSVR